MLPLTTRIVRELQRHDVTEVAVATGRLPCGKVDGKYVPMTAEKLPTPSIFELLGELGGPAIESRLGATPVQWTYDVDGLGTLAVAAVKKSDQVQARIVVAKRSVDGQRGTLRKAPASSGDEDDLPPMLASAVVGAGARVVAAAGGSSTALLERDELPSRPELDPAPGAGARSAPAVSFELDYERGPAAAAAPPAPPERLGDLQPTASLDGVMLSIDAVDARTGVRAPKEAAPIVPPKAPAPAAVVEAQPAAPTVARPSLKRVTKLDDILEAARATIVSDVHIVAERPVLFRFAGELINEGEVIGAGKAEELILPMIPERLREVFEREGSADFALAHGRFGRFRANVVRQRTGLKASLRLIPDTVPTLASLGLPSAIAAATHHHQGLIVVTGPTGHGKTTTLTALVDLINSETHHHIITVEDPVEFVHPRKKAMLSQREVGTHTKSFRSALKGSLREDPDVIVIGELRDTETVRIALGASETGHLVIGTMNTPSAAKTIDRLIDLFPPGDQQQVRMTLAGGLKLVMSQRLVPSKDRMSRHAAVELLPGSVPLWSLIRDSKTFQIPSLQQRGKALGITRLDDSLLELLRADKVDLEEALAVAESPDDLRARFATPQKAQGAPTQDGSSKKDDPQGKGILGKAGSIFGRKG